MNTLPIASRFPVRILRPAAGLASVGLLSLTLLAGCGGHSKTVTSSSTDNAAFSSNGRSYTASNITMGSQTGTLIVTVTNDYSSGENTITATANVGASATSESKAAKTRQATASASSAVAVPLTGTFNASSGAFSLAGSVNRGSAKYAITLTGTMNTSADGGSATITVNGVSAPVTFSGSVYSYNQVSPDYFPLANSTNFAYQETYTSSDGTVGASDTFNGYSFLGSDPSAGTTSSTGTTAAGSPGNMMNNTPSGPGIVGIGSQVGKASQTQLNNTPVLKTTFTDSGDAGSFNIYYAINGAALTVYEYETLDANQKPEYTDSYDTGKALPFTLYEGQISTQSFKETNRNIYSYSYTLTDVDGTETFTYPDGSTYPYPDNGNPPTFPTASTYASDDGSYTDTITVSGSTATEISVTKTPYNMDNDTTVTTATSSGLQETHSDDDTSISPHTVTTTFNGFEQITVPAGTFTAAKYTVVDTISIPAVGSSSAQTTVDTTTYYLASGIGVVQENDVTTQSYPAETDSDGTVILPASSYTSSYDLVLTSTTGAGASSESRGRATRSTHASRFAAFRRAMAIQRARVIARARMLHNKKSR